MVNKRYLTLFLIIIPVSFLCYGLFDLFISGRSVIKTAASIKHTPFKHPGQDTIYNFLLRKDRFLTSALTYYSSSREPLSTYIYNSQIYITILKLDGTYDKPLNETITLTSKKLSQNNGAFYDQTFKPEFITFKRKLGRAPQLTNQYYFNLSGDSIRLLRSSKNILYYRFRLAKASISYSDNNIVDLIMERI